MNSKPISYLQTDSRWANISYSVPGETTTIGKSGCGPTSAAMLLATLTGDTAINPKTECAWALAHGYKALNSGTYYGYFTPAFLRYGITCTKLNGATIYGNSTSKYHAQAKAALERGDYVIACMGKGNWTSSGHYVVVYGIDGDTVYINDPASTKTRRTAGSYSLFKQQVKYYWVISTPTKKEKTDMNMEETRAIAREVAVQVVQENTPIATVYNSVADCPDWARPTIQKMVDKGFVNGELDGQLNLSYDLLRLFVVNDRAGLYG